VDLSSRERENYLEHFKPHGVTPKQFEEVSVAGTNRLIKAGGVVRREGELIKSVKIIVWGNTRASTLGRRFTAMGSKESNQDAKQGDNSGRSIVTAIVIANASIFFKTLDANRAAIAGKVVNLMASQQTALLKLSTWLDQWKYSRISQKGEETSESEDDDEDDNENVTRPWKIDIDANRQHLVLCVHV
jgi:hypothetical protein